MPNVILREEIVRRLRDRLARVRVTNGFRTDAGLRVTVGREFIDVSTPLPRLVLIPGGDGRVPEEITQGKQVGQRLPILVEGAIAMDGLDSMGPGEALIADIKQALFDPTDHKLGMGSWVEDIFYAPPLGHYLDREPGTKWVRVEHGAVIVFREKYGDPTVDL